MDLLTDVDKEKLVARAIRTRVVDVIRYHKNAEYKRALAKKYYCERMIRKKEDDLLRATQGEIIGVSESIQPSQ